jgi:2-polyprenyl-3-methyl-5-hydroxy-6-metoxy-1,4-benzoquinol methylase
MNDEWRKYHSRWEGRHWLDRAMEHWDFYAKFHRKLCRHLRAGDSLLDIGSGKGYSALYFAAHGYPVTGIDFDVPSVEEANEWASRLGLPARFHVCDIFDFQPEERYRISYSIGLIEHFAPEEARRLLAVRIPQSAATLRRTFASSGLNVIESFGCGDVSSKWDSRLKSMLPHAALHFLQNRLDYAMNVVTVGR